MRRASRPKVLPPAHEPVANHRPAAAGDFAEARAESLRLLAAGQEPAAEARLRLRAGRASVSLDRPDEALPDLRRGRALFESIGDEPMAIECLDWIAAALALCEDPAARTAAEEALRRARHARDGLDAALRWRVLARAGSICAWQGEPATGARRLETALACTRTVHDVPWIATVASDLAVALAQLGDRANASRYAERAGRAVAMMTHAPSRSRTAGQVGRALRRLGDADRGERWLRDALHDCEANAVRFGRAALLLELAEASYARGALPRATALATRALAAAEETGERVSTGGAHRLRARLAADRCRRAEARHELERAIDALTGVHEGEALADCHARLGRLLEDRGELVAAAGHWKAAALIPRPRSAAAPRPRFDRARRFRAADVARS